MGLRLTSWRQRKRGMIVAKGIAHASGGENGLCCSTRRRRRLRVDGLCKKAVRGEQLDGGQKNLLVNRPSSPPQ